MTRLTLMHDTAGPIGMIRSEIHLIKKYMEKGKAEERLPIMMKSILNNCDRLVKTLDKWYVEDKEKEEYDKD